MVRRHDGGASARFNFLGYNAETMRVGATVLNWRRKVKATHLNRQHPDPASNINWVRGERQPSILAAGGVRGGR